MNTNTRHLVVAAGAIALAAAGLASCFSERASIAGTDGGEVIECGGKHVTGTAPVIAIRDFAFHPDTVRITPGMTVVWVNCEEAGIESHTSTSDADLWDSELLAPGDVYTFTFDDAGEFGYHCEPHPFMRGAVIVEE